MFSPDLPLKTTDILKSGRYDIAPENLDAIKAPVDANMASNLYYNSANGGMFPTDTIDSQTPKDISSISSSGGSASNVLSFPANLGSDNVKHYVKFEVFIIKTENLNLVNHSKAQKESAYDDFAIPRMMQNQGGVASDIQKNQVKYTKLQQMIGLPLPEGLVADYSMAWSKSEGGMVSGVVSLADAVTDSEKKEKYSFLNHAGLGVASGITNLASQVGFDGAETNLKLLTKRASNPRNEFLFDGVNNRSFAMAWKFIPKDEKESMLIKEILEKMKLYMHPELDESTAGKFYIFPAIFDITFMSGDKENEFLHRTTSCALTNMMVNHNGAGMASFFDGTDAPFAYDVNMQFTELEFLHRKRFKTENNPDGVVR